MQWAYFLYKLHCCCEIYLVTLTKNEAPILLFSAILHITVNCFLINFTTVFDYLVNLRQNCLLKILLFQKFSLIQRHTLCIKFKVKCNVLFTFSFFIFQKCFDQVIIILIKIIFIYMQILKNTKFDNNMFKHFSYYYD